MSSKEQPKFYDEIGKARDVLVKLAHAANRDLSLDVADKAQAAIRVLTILRDDMQGTVFEEATLDWEPEGE